MDYPNLIKRLVFPKTPFIYAYIQSDYDRASTTPEMIQLHFKWLEEAEKSTNNIRKEAYLCASMAIYTELTGRSYQTKQFKIETMSEKDSTEDLKSRVGACREQLKELNVIGARLYFTVKYPEYKPKNEEDKKTKDRLNNLWYGKVTDKDFTEKLETFVKFKRVQFS